jgi:hypothetical protein
VDQTSGTTPAGAPPTAPDSGQPGDLEPAGAPPGATGFGARGRVRRRARFLRKARELAYRDLGGLVFNLDRFGQRNDALVLAKLATLTKIDSELRSIEAALSSRHPITVLREAGVTACPRCAAIHSGEDHFCPGCGLPLSRHVDLPISGVVSSPQPAVAGAPQSVAPAAPQSAPPPSGAPTHGAGVPPAPRGAAAATESSVAAQPAPAAEPAAAAPPAPAARRSRTTPAAPEPAAPASPSAAPAGRSPVPPSKPKPPEPGMDDGEQPTQAFSSGAPST